ncbi:MAG TPA: penicillin acylase family protein [Anaerolineales bacterium]|nr:penicillin acylase family protein [Anaerolineales bacterium]
MFTILRRILLGLLALVLIIVLALVILIPLNLRRSFPQTAGEIHLSGLDGPVDIYRDRFGVPNIYAKTKHDLFFAQGYVHAQDRFWQMDLWRHQGAGRLSELVGDSTLETDVFLRTLGWERVSREELQNLDSESLAMLQAYSEGVNAYLSDHQGAALSMEYFFLPVLNRGYQIQPWEPLNTVTWAKAMAWDLSGNMDTEIDRAELLKTLSPQQVAQLFPPYPSDHPVIVPDAALATSYSDHRESDTTLWTTLSPALQQVQGQMLELDSLFGGSFKGIGSNSWVISGGRTATGKPLLANDPHLGAQMPSIWYEVGLHCAPQSAECPYEVSGFSFAGVPGVIIGHNDRIAWGFTNVGPDVMDLYIEKINPANPDQYEFEGKWVDMQLIQDSIQVAGGQPKELTVRLTRHGPLITEAYGLQDFAEKAGVDLPEHTAIALRWTALEPSNVFRAIWGFNLAQNWDEFRDAARDFAVPSQNLVYADVDGNIGYQMPGNIPIRNKDHSGELPVPGWTGENEWQGYIPFEELPFSFNPSQGYIVTANNAVVGPDYPYAISLDWDRGFRAQRIIDMIESASNKITVEDIQRMQGDDRALIAESIVPVLMQISLEDSHLSQARDLLLDWDYQFRMDSAPAALFGSFWRHLLEITFTDDLPEFYKPSGSDTWMEIMRQLVAEPESAWWDDQRTAQTETRDDIFRQALGAAVNELDGSLGNDPGKWQWGDLHTLTLQNQVMTNFPLVQKLFDRGPFRTSGGSDIVNATGWNSSQSYEVQSLPSMRMIVDLGGLNNSLSMHTTGQSGHAYHPHYIDMADPWRTIQYHPMLWEQNQVQTAAEGHLILSP